jgi:hypothetical protein
MYFATRKGVHGFLLQQGNRCRCKLFEPVILLPADNCGGMPIQCMQNPAGLKAGARRFFPRPHLALLFGLGGRTYSPGSS